MFFSDIMNAAKHEIYPAGTPEAPSSGDTAGMKIETLNPVQHQIIQELSRAFERLGAETGIFAALHSWGDTMPEKDVLRMLKELNDDPEAQGVLSTSTSSTHV